MKKEKLLKNKTFKVEFWGKSNLFARRSGNKDRTMEFIIEAPDKVLAKQIAWYNFRQTEYGRYFGTIEFKAKVKEIKEEEKGE